MTTKLEILNHMLNVVSEAPVSSADSSHPTAISALVVLNRVNKEVQSRGWWFNTEYGLNLLPDSNGHIVVPSDTLSIDPVDTSSRLVKRSGKLYDPINHTLVIDQAVPVNVVLQLPIEDLPESAALFIQHRAAYDFYVNDDGDETKSNRLEKTKDDAWAALQQEQLQSADVNSNNRPTSALLKSGIRQWGSRYNPNLPGGGA